MTDPKAESCIREMKIGMRRIIAVLLAIACVVSMSACSGNTAAQDRTGNTEDSDIKKLKIVTTIFPEYDWVREILGTEADKADVTILMDHGVDLHSYQPTAEDIATITACDLFIYVGGESDGWVEDALAESVNDDMHVINLLEVLGEKVKEEEVVEGMQGEEEEEEEEEEGPEYDEHVWLSLKNTEIFVQEIADAICDLDAESQEVYSRNADAYIEALSSLDRQYADAVDQSAKHTILFGDRFPFRYLTDDYGLTYYAAFVGCSAETEASFETIVFLANKVDEENLDYVLTIDGSDGKIAETIIQNTEKKDQQVLKLNAMQSITSSDIEQGSTYLSIMEENLEVLKTALN